MFLVSGCAVGPLDNSGTKSHSQDCRSPINRDTTHSDSSHAINQTCRFDPTQVSRWFNQLVAMLSAAKPAWLARAQRRGCSQTPTPSPGLERDLLFTVTLLTSR